MKGMSTKLKAYTLFIISLGMMSIFLGLINISADIMPSLAFFATLGIIAESLNIRIRGSAAVSVSFTIGLSAVLIYQSYLASIIGFMSMFFCIESVNGEIVHILNTSKYKRLFNGCAYALSLAVASISYRFFKIDVLYMNFLGLNIVSIIACVIAYLVTNSLIFMGLMALLEKKKFRQVFSDNKWAMLNILALSPLGTIIAASYQNYGWFAVILFFGPLLIARYSFKLYMDMRHVYFETIKALSSAMEAKDQYTNGHSYRVADYAVGIAEQMGLKADVIDKLRTAAILHDIGKIGIADSILNKSGQLENNEYLEIQKHPEIGAKILSEVDFLAEVAHIIKHHHERYDGKGYPDKLEGPQISIESCILAVADAYDAMTSDRPYRRAMSQQTAMNIVLEQVGKQFNPVVVKSFIDYLNAQPKEHIAHVS